VTSLGLAEGNLVLVSSKTRLIVVAVDFFLGPLVGAKKSVLVSCGSLAMDGDASDDVDRSLRWIDP